MSEGIVLQVADEGVAKRAEKAGVGYLASNSWAMPWEKTLFAAPDTAIPWDLLPAGMHFLQRWDVAAPLWRYGVLAQDVGTTYERERTEAVIRDLRVLLYAHELLFVRDSDAGRTFIETWRADCASTNGDAPEERLAFLRALYLVKPLFCSLPRSWLADAQKRMDQEAKAVKLRSKVHQQTMVRVQIGPNMFVSCPEGQEAKTVERFARMRERGAKGG
jgi:hypothetical protein